MKRYILRCKCNMIVDACQEPPKETCEDCKQTMSTDLSEEGPTFTLTLTGTPWALYILEDSYFQNLKDSLQMEAWDKRMMS